MIVIEFAKVLGVNLHLAGIADSHGVAQGYIFGGHLADSADNIGQLANTGGFDDNTVRIVLGDHLFQRLAEVTNQAAADAAGVHLSDVDAGILQEAAVNADLAKFVLDQNQLLACISLLDHLFDQGRLTGTQEAGVNINFRHNLHLLYIKFQDIL